MSVLQTVVSGLTGALLSASPAWSAEEPPTFSRDVAPILYSSCVSCHRPGEIGPMPLITYQQVRPWVRSIRQKVVSREMPPWTPTRPMGPSRTTGRSASARLTSSTAGLRRWRPSGQPHGADEPAGLRGRLANRQAGFGLRTTRGVRGASNRHDWVQELQRADAFQGRRLGGGSGGPCQGLASRSSRGRDHPGARRQQAIERSGRPHAAAGRAGPRHVVGSRARADADGLGPLRQHRAPSGWLCRWRAAACVPSRTRETCPGGRCPEFLDALHDHALGRDRTKVGLIVAKTPPKARFSWA